MSHVEDYMGKVNKKYYKAMDKAVLISEEESELASNETMNRYNEIWRVKRESEELAEKVRNEEIMNYVPK